MWKRNLVHHTVSPRERVGCGDETLFTTPFLLVRGWGVETKLGSPSSPRERVGCGNETWFTTPFLLVRGWGLGMRLGSLGVYD